MTPVLADQAIRGQEAFVHIGLVCAAGGALVLAVLDFLEVRDKPSARGWLRVVGDAIVGIGAGLGSFTLTQSDRFLPKWGPFIGVLVIAASMLTFFEISIRRQPLKSVASSPTAETAKADETTNAD